MGIFKRLLTHIKGNRCIMPSEDGVASFLASFGALMAEDKYISRRDYWPLVGKYESAYSKIADLASEGLLREYTKKQKLSLDDVQAFLDIYSDIKDKRKGSARIEEKNRNFIERHIFEDKAYFDTLLKDIDPNISLDREQREAILSDEDYTLIIAGAGAGKTTTLAGKVKYLVEKKGINPRDILLISFTNKAVGELKERIQEKLGIDCPICTFHSAGNAVLHKTDDVKKQIVDDGFLFSVVRDYMKNVVLTQPEIVNKLVLFFGTYFDMPYEGDDINAYFNYIAKADFSTLKSNLREYNEVAIDRLTREKYTINNEMLRSVQEVKIANFLYLNGIDYTYEEIYPYHILKAKKPYAPDFCIRQGKKTAYIEHFGINENGTHSFYTKDELAKYKKEIKDKIDLHKSHGTTLLYTFSSYKDGRDFLDHLKEQLYFAGFELRPVDANETFKKLVGIEENKYIFRFVKLVTMFISNFKTNGYDETKFDDFKKIGNVRDKLFMDICKACYLQYERALFEQNKRDFQDMINESARLMTRGDIKEGTINFKYVIVDEYQDISRQRFDFTKAISRLCDAKIIAVGDDWQSIYAFSGSDITLFTRFCAIMGYGKELKITHTYRNAQEVIDIAGTFIQKNPFQIQKSLISPFHIDKPVIIQAYTEETDKTKLKGGRYADYAKEVKKAIEHITKKNAEEGKSADSTILLIGRYNFDVVNLCMSGHFTYDENNGKVLCNAYPKARITYLTAHSSKGLGYDNVIIINAQNATYGFPSKRSDDHVMDYVTVRDRSMDYAEERRLFYVAMTRTKNRVYIITPSKNPSEFVLELERDYAGITHIGPKLLKTGEEQSRVFNRCPICGYPLLLRYKKNFGLKLWMCSNDPEICTFITNRPKSKMSIQKCDNCRDGYLIVKEGKTLGSYILGCTNYKEDGTGCNRVMSLAYYISHFKEGFEEDISAALEAYSYAPAKNPAPTTKAKNEEPDKKRQKPYAVTVKKELTLDKEKFDVIASQEGEIFTDEALLEILRKERDKIANERHILPRDVVSRKGLVSLATHKPQSKEEFVSLEGLGDASYTKCGDRLMKEIEKYLNEGTKS